MSSKTFFISDSHLHYHNSEAEEVKRRYLFEFFREVKKQKGNLFIVGDLFDFWFEYKYVIPRHFFKVLRHLQEMVESGCEVHIFGGNHDFWMGSFFKEELGVSVYYDPTDIVLNSKIFYISHGDEILKNDKGYHILKKILRNRLAIWLFRLLHPDLAFKIAAKVSTGSYNQTLKNPGIREYIRREIIEFGKRKFQEGINYVITGHYHIPTEYREGENVFLNLGDWIKYFSFGYFDGKNLSLCYWNKKSSKLQLK